jgi:DNA polymerase I-like protein with 3'-5' exonuclease and polymerase domains/5'-3' exonuclease
MRNRTRIVYDLSSVAKRCYFAGQDKEHGFKVEFEEKQVHVNGWQYGFENFLNSVDKTLREHEATPIDIIFIREGENGSQLRRNIFPGYKDKSKSQKPPEQLEQYVLMENKIVEFFKRLGSVFVKLDGREADDVFAYLMKNLTGPRVGVADDADMLILAQIPDVKIRYQSKVINPEENPLGPWPLELNRIYKALVGDKSDTLPGAFGFGDAKFTDLYCAADVDGMKQIEEVIENADWASLEEDALSPTPGGKAIKLMLEHKDTVRRCYRCVQFFDEEIGSPGKELQWDAGIVLEKPEGEPEDDRFDRWYQTRTLVTSGNFAQLMASGVWARVRKSPWVTLDLETATPPESDEWLARINDPDYVEEIESDDEDEDPQAETQKKRAGGVDVLASKIVSMGVTLGENCEHTLYLTVDHKTDRNITMHNLYQFLARLIREDVQIRFPVHSSAFELPVWFMNLIEWTESDEAFDSGFMPRIDDTFFMASYVDENVSLGLKQQAEMVLGYQQVTYEEVTQGRKMNQLTPQEAFMYGTDDTIVTAALRNYYEIVMQIERTFDLYREVEIDASYLSNAGYITGVNFSREEMRKQERADDKIYDAAWAKLRTYLIEKKWDGVELPAVTLEPASMKVMYEIVTGTQLECKARTPSKIVAVMRQNDDAGTLADLYDWSIANAGDMSFVEKYVRQFYKGEPNINSDSPAQMSRLLYEVMNLPVRARNRPTKAMKAAQGRSAVGTPKTDALAIASAKFYDSETHPTEVAMLDAIHDMRAVGTRRKMYYRPYKALPHWMDNTVHGSDGQCRTVTRRFAPNKPNKAQWPKGEKGDFRATIKPHHHDAAIVALDFKAQELRVIADASGDEAMTSCFVGDNLRDMHHMTGVSIALRKFKDKVDTEITYEWFATAIDDENHPMHKQMKSTRKRAKTTNFATEYGAMAPKLAATLMVPEEEAQSYLEAKLATFWRAEEWKKEEIIPQAKRCGYSLTLLGGRRHLAKAFGSSEWWERSRAERQAVNFVIQGSCAEMTKLAMGRIWRAKLIVRYDATFIGVVHDELVFSVGREDIVAFTKELHALMTMQYAKMTIPIESSIGIGHDFLNLIEIGEVPSDVKIQGAIDRLWPQHAANDSQRVAA